MLGSESRLGQFLRGQLAELTIVNNDTESDHVIGCINSCREKIDFHAISEMDTGMVCSAVDSDNQHFLPLGFIRSSRSETDRDLWIQRCSCLEMEILSDYLNLAAMMLQHSSSMDRSLKQG